HVDNLARESKYSSALKVRRKVSCVRSSMTSRCPVARQMTVPTIRAYAATRAAQAPWSPARHAPTRARSSPSPPRIGRHAGMIRRWPLSVSPAKDETVWLGPRPIERIPDAVRGVRMTDRWLVLVGIVGAVLVLGWLIYWVYRAKLLEREERRLMIERGMTPPPPQPVGWPAVR